MARPSKKEIQELRDWLVQVHHKDRLAEQELDQKYVNDDFTIPYLPEGVVKMRTGKAYRMVSAPAEHIITANPKLYRSARGKGELQAERVAKEGNRWLGLMLRQSPQPLKEHVKKILGKGEGYIYLAHNEAYNREDPNDMPVIFTIPDPTIVFVDPYAGEKNGVPGRIIIYTRRIAWQVREDYPFWKWTERSREQTFNSMVDFMMYYDDEYRYFEAAGDSLFNEMDDNGKIALDSKGDTAPYNGDGVQENFYGVVPLVHCYTGFGEGSADNNPASLAVSRIRNTRDLIAEYTAMRSVLNNLVFKYAEPSLDYYYDPQIGSPNPDFKKEYSRAPGAFNEVPVLGVTDPLQKGVDKLPEQELFQHLFNVERAIDEEDPLGEIGQAIGTSGRQQLDAKEGALRRYDTVVENSAHAWERAFGLALRLIEKMPSIRPQGLNKGDIGGHYDVQIDLKAEDPTAMQILSQDGDLKQQNGIIDHHTNLTHYQGYTDEEAEDIEDSLMVDQVIKTNPVIQTLMAVQVAREMGMEQEYQAMAQQLQGMEGSAQAMPTQLGPEGGPPRTQNIQSLEGRMRTDLSRAQRPQRLRP